MTIFVCMTITKNLINCKSFIDYKSHKIQKIPIEVMIDLVTRTFAVCVNTIGEVIK